MVQEALRDCARRPGFWIWSVVQVAAAATCAAFAISARPGYESALVLAPVAATGSGFIAAGAVVRARRLHEALSLPHLLVRVLVSTLPAVLASLLVLVAAASIRGFCDPLQGLGFFVTGPLCSALAAGGLATVIVLAVPGRRWLFAAWIAALGASFAWDAALLYHTPQVFVFDHLLGTFGGPLYDEAVGLETRHLVFRLFTVARFGALLVLAHTLHDPRRHRLAPSHLSRRAPRAALGAFVIVLLATFLAEPALGLRSSQSEIRRRLGGTTVTKHFIIHHPQELTERQVAFLEAEAEIRWNQLREFFGDAPERRLTLTFFRTGREMRHLTGTGPTNVAKPWLGAAFMVYEGPPHPVAKHEMAHLFSAKWGRGPFRTPGALWGILADPMLLEGTAVAADWRGDPLDPHTRSAAILEIGLIDDPAELAGATGFYTHQGGLAYVMAGSFVRWLWSTHGADPIHRWYAGAPFEEAFGTTRREALDSWQDHLRTIDVPPRWLSALERRYSRKSVFHRPCPHQVALLLGRAASSRIAGDTELSSVIMDRICEIAPDDTGLEVVRLGHLISTGSITDARSEVNELLEPGAADAGYQAKILEHAGDVSWLAGGDGAARRYYTRALGLSAEDAAVRMLTVKLWAVTHPEPGRELRAYLTGSTTDPGNIPALLGHLAAHNPGEPLLGYLLGRAHFNAGDWQDAAASLEPSIYGLIETPLIQAEALRLLAAARLWSGDRTGSLDAIDRLEKMGPPSPALRYHAGEWRALAEAMK